MKKWEVGTCKYCSCTFDKKTWCESYDTAEMHYHGFWRRCSHAAYCLKHRERKFVNLVQQRIRKAMPHEAEVEVVPDVARPIMTWEEIMASPLFKKVGFFTRPR